MTPEWLRILNALTCSRQACAMATVVAVEGSVSADLGAKAVFAPDGQLLAGWIGGGCAQARAGEVAQQVMSSGHGQLLTLDLRDEFLGSGMPCGGCMTVFIDPILPPPMLWVLGSGPLAEALCRQGAQTGFAVTVLDSRAERERFPTAWGVVNDDPAYETLATLDAADYVVIATQHKGDHLILRRLLARPVAYVGLIASRHRARLVQADLQQSGLPPALWAKVHAPAGLDLGARSPEEIALAVVAEMMAQRRHSSARPRSIFEDNP
jgi:xanthine dehydrogenase accessory factor